LKGKQLRLWDFYELENLSKKRKKFLSFTQLFMTDHSLEETLEVLRTSGACFNPYSPSQNVFFDS